MKYLVGKKYLPCPIYMAFCLILISSCTALDPQVQGTEPVKHELFDSLLKKHVSENGLVNYTSFQEDRALLQSYLNQLTLNPPNDENWTREQKLAYWINLYNAFTIELILEYYPVKSIKDIGASIQVPFVNTPWDIKMIDIGEEQYDLNNIEHNILRKNFDEPRIHFAINCASISCPKLRREAYHAEKIDQQLNEQTREFLNDPSKNKINSEVAEISKIFKWFGGDFEKETTISEYINRYSQYEISKGIDLNYMEYNWSLNEEKQ